MDQVKEILRQVIKHRFWITVGISLLLPAIAYAVGSGKIKTEAEQKTGEITKANDDVKKYSSGVIPNSQYKPEVDKKKDELSHDVNASWKKLYSQQAPLLTWPANVQERFQKWDRKWPENEDASTVQTTIIEYVNSYTDFVTQVYQTFRPFDPAEGTGVVAAPSQDILLHPSPFDATNPPELGKVWAAQERLWIQRTLLQVVADVNKSATGWDSAYVKQVNLLEVGSPLAQDQVSIAKGDTPEEAPAITNPAAPPPAVEASPSGGSSGSAPNPMEMALSGGQQNVKTDALFYIKSASPNQYKILPFEMTVLVEQNHIQDFLVALENSPMAIQVNDFEMAKPATRVTKPKKGENMGFGGMYAGDGGTNYNYQMMAMMMQRSTPGNTTAFGGDSSYRMMTMMRNAPGGPMGGTSASKKGVDVRSKDRKEEREKEQKAAAKTTTVTVHDPYFNVVEVTVYGQARFYNPPPPEPTPEPSLATEAAPAEETPKTEGDAKTAETPKTETPKSEEAKTETPKTEPEKAKADEPKAKEETPKADEPKAKEETPKAEPEKPKADEPKSKDEAKKS